MERKYRVAAYGGGNRMTGLQQDYPQEGAVRIPSGCAISGIFSRNGRRFGEEEAIRSISVMHDRSNGLGGGYAGYGIYPEYKDHYAFHVFYYDKTATKENLEEISLSIDEFCRVFSLDKEAVMQQHFFVLTPNTSNPYKRLYTYV